MRVGRHHCPRRDVAALRFARAWRRAASRGLAFAALLALILAPLNICCVDGRPAAAMEAAGAAILEAAVGAATPLKLCAHGSDGGGRQTPAPAPSPADHCPICQTAHASGPIPAPAVAIAARSPVSLETVAPPQFLAAAAGPDFHLGRARAPPHLI